MKRSYLTTYYPNGISMEDRLFTAGERNTRIPMGIWLSVLGVGIAVAVLGLLVAFEEEDIGFFLFGLGDLAVAVGITGVGIYAAGLHCLERAELLYNTRMAGKVEEEENDYSAPATPQTTSGYATVSGWTCICGKKNADYMSVCTCGTKKQEAKQARQNAAPQRTAGGWVCTCGREHPSYVSSCTCGVNKRDIK